jgi:porin
MKTIYALLSIVLFFGFSTAQAYDLTTSPWLTGDWGGARTQLADKGIEFNLGYGSEIAHNFSGGDRQMTDYTDQWLVGAGFNFEKMGLWHGGTARITMTDRNGSNLGGDARIGNDMLLQEVYGRGQTLHMTQFWYNQKFFDDKVEWKAGRLTVGEDFASFSCNFQNLSFCGAQPGNLVGSYWLNWPTSVWATNVKYHSSEEITWQVGAYQVNPTYVDNSYADKYGWTLDNPSGSNGTLIPAEMIYKPTVMGFVGSYKFGVWYNTAKGPEVTNNTTYSAQYGGYINFEQPVTGTKEAPQMSVFLNVTQAASNTAAIDRQISLGTQYHGIFGRGGDSVAFAVGTTNNVGVGSEYDAELYYSYAPIPSVYFRPNVQYVMDPGGTSANADAFVLGLKTGVAF